MEDVPGSAIGPKILKRAPPRKHAVAPASSRPGKCRQERPGECCTFAAAGARAQLQPVVDPQVSQRMQVPLRTRLK